MRLSKVLRHRFVETIPSSLEEGVIYVSIEYATAIHKCCCGCGKEVVTPFSPTDWTLSFDGETISLDPSIGNWNFECRSHYWIINNKVHPAPRWSEEKIVAGQRYDRLLKQQYFNDLMKTPKKTSYDESA